MILVRDVFQLKFGKAREAAALWKEGVAIAQKAGYGRAPMRLLTDLTGQAYTLVLESSFTNLAEYEQQLRGALGTDEWRTWYQKFVPLAESSRRDIFTIVE